MYDSTVLKLVVEEKVVLLLCELTFNDEIRFRNRIAMIIKTINNEFLTFIANFLDCIKFYLIKI